MTTQRAETQDIRPLKLAILNLMPKKEETETQLLRMLSNTALQVHVDLIRTDSHKSKNTDYSHLHRFYKTFDEIKQNKYDAMIITGLPLKLWNMKMLIIGKNLLKFWNMQRNMCFRQCLFAGHHKRHCIITME